MRNDEDQIQRTVAQYLNAKGLLWTHVPNGGKRSLLTAVRLKAAGVSPGVCDVLIFEPSPREGGVGCAIELKKDKGGRVSPHQKRWIEGLAASGWKTAVCHGVDEALAMLKDWGF